MEAGKSMSYVIHTTVSWQQTMRELRETMAKWGVADWDMYKPSERGGTVMLKYVKNGRSVTLPMGSQARADDNLRVLYLAVEATRMNDKRGLGEVIQDAYLQLAGPEPTIDPRYEPYQTWCSGLGKDILNRYRLACYRL
jgi:hypothetical protein